MVKLRYFLCLILFHIAVFAQSEVTINVWIHGTYPALNMLTHKKSPFRTWVYAPFGLSLAKDLPENYYFNQLAHNCSALNTTEYNLDHFYLFGWYSSNMRPGRRKHEGKKLQQDLDVLLQEYRTKYDKIKLRLIGVSHGGNVVLNCIHHMPEYNNIQIEVVLLATPIQESTREYVNNAPVHKIYSFYSNYDWMQRIDAQKFHHDAPKKCPFWSSRTFKDSDRVVQVRLKINNKYIGHGKYRSIAHYLPNIMQAAEFNAGSSDREHISLNFTV